MFGLSHTFAKVLSLLSHRERYQAGGIVLLALCSAIGESGGILSITLILAVGANPAITTSNRVLHAIYRDLGFHSTHTFTIVLGLVSLATLLIGVGLQAMNQWASAWFVQMRSYEISRRLMLEYARRDYVFFLNSNSALLAETLLTEIQTVISGVFTPMMMAISEGCVAILLLLLLCMSVPALAGAVALLLGGGYLLVYFLIGSYVDRAGSQRQSAAQGRYIAASEMFGGIKEIRLLGCEEIYFDRFSMATYRFARTQVTSQLVANLPRYIMQTIAYGTILLLIIYLMNGSGGLGGALPIVGLFALSGRRLLPALQNVYANMSTVRFSQSALDKLIDELKAAPKIVNASRPKRAPLKFAQTIRFDQVRFQYPGAKQVTLHDISLTIAAGARIGFVGPTGSGKTTIVDVLLGLLRPTSGTIQVDGLQIDAGNLPSWQALFGYVPQHIYLTDESVSKNIAFGVPPEDIDQEKVEQVARIANIHEFIVNEMPQGYDSVVGERGIRLSGGQRQRLGIARALYRQPQVLVFDEATSALDNVTERELMKAMAELGNDRTLIMIAHRLSTVRDCDTIFLLEHGHLKASGTYDELVAGNERFRDMATANG